MEQEQLEYIKKKEELAKKWAETGDDKVFLEFMNLNRRKKVLPVEDERRNRAPIS